MLSVALLWRWATSSESVMVLRRALIYVSDFFVRRTKGGGGGGGGKRMRGRLFKIAQRFVFVK